MASGYNARGALRQRNDKDKDYDHLFKFVMTGDCYTGKSCLLLRFADDTYRERHIMTIGVDFKIRTIELDGKLIKIQIWDTAGHERFQSFTRGYYRGADGIILVYDITNQASFEHLPSWLEEVNLYAPENCAKLIVGNKSDMECQRSVEYRTAKRYADFCGIPLLETSAKEALNVDQAFVSLAAAVKNTLPDNDLRADDQPFSITGHDPEETGYYYSCDSCWGSGLLW